MKKVFTTLLVAGLAMTAMMADHSTLSIDRDALFAKSKAGQNFLRGQEQLKASAEAEVRAMEQKIREKSKRLEQQVSMLSQETIMEKQIELSKDIRTLKRTQEEKQQDLKMGIEMGVERIRGEQRKVANKILEEKNGGVIVDTNAPYIVAVSAKIDITNEVLKRVDADFARSSITKKDEKKA